MPELPRRKNMRLQGYDYAQNGYYFITICTKGRLELLCEIRSEIRRGGALLRPLGTIAKNEIENLCLRYNIVIKPFVIMPNHMHLIIELNDRAEQSTAPTTIGNIIRAYKSITTKLMNGHDQCHGRQIWQRGYYDHIIRDENDYLRICEYIENNPLKWEEDKYYDNQYCGM